MKSRFSILSLVVVVSMLVALTGCQQSDDAAAALDKAAGDLAKLGNAITQSAQTARDIASTVRKADVSKDVVKPAKQAAMPDAKVTTEATVPVSSAGAGLAEGP